MELNLKALSNKIFKFDWEDPMRQTQVEICIPDLSNLENSVWGNWGLMYTFELYESAPIEIKYDDKVYKSSQKRLHVDSPILAKERELSPYFLIIEDEIKNLKFKLFINREYELGKVEVIRSKDRLKLYEKVEADHFLSLG